MHRCSRPGCAAPAIATFNFDGLRRILWIAPASDTSAFSAGSLCRRHADRLAAPRNWELRDTRPRPSLDHASTGGVAAPSRFAVPDERPGARALPLPLERTAADAAALPGSRTASPRVGRRVAALLPAAARLPETHLDAPTPLLSRAFRSAG